MRRLRVGSSCVLALFAMAATAVGQAPPATPPPTGTPATPMPPPTLQPLVAPRVLGTRRAWSSFAGWPAYVAPVYPGLYINLPSAVLRAVTGPARNRAVRIQVWGQVFLPSCTENCAPGQLLLGRTMGARVSAYLVRGTTCPTSPPTPSATRIPLLKSSGTPWEPVRPYADLPPGFYDVTVTVPLRGLAPGTYTGCTWADASATNPVTNPFATVTGDPAGALGASPDAYYGVTTRAGARALRITR